MVHTFLYVGLLAMSQVVHGQCIDGETCERHGMKGKALLQSKFHAKTFVPEEPPNLVKSHRLSEQLQDDDGPTLLQLKLHAETSVQQEPPKLVKLNRLSEQLQDHDGPWPNGGKKGCAHSANETEWCTWFQAVQAHLALRNSLGFEGWSMNPQKASPSALRFRYEVKRAGGNISEGGKGLGVFAAERIKVDELVDCEDLDGENTIYLPPTQREDLEAIAATFPKNVVELAMAWCGRDWACDRKGYICERRDSRFINDAVKGDVANVGKCKTRSKHTSKEKMYCLCALRQIEKGEEIIESYDDPWVGLYDNEFENFASKLLNMAGTSHNNTCNQHANPLFLFGRAGGNDDEHLGIVMKHSYNSWRRAYALRPKHIQLCIRWAALFLCVLFSSLLHTCMEKSLNFRNTRSVLMMLVLVTVLTISQFAAFRCFTVPVIVAFWAPCEKCIQIFFKAFIHQHNLWRSDCLRAVMSIGACVAVFLYQEVLVSTTELHTMPYLNLTPSAVARIEIVSLVACAASFIASKQITWSNRFFGVMGVQLTCAIKYLSVPMTLAFDLMALVILIDGTMTLNIDHVIASLLCLLAWSFTHIVMEATLATGWILYLVDAIDGIVLPWVLMFLYNEFPRENAFAMFLLFACVTGTDFFGDQIQASIQVLTDIIAPAPSLQTRIAAIRVGLGRQNDSKDEAQKVFVILGSGAVGQLVIHKLTSIVGSTVNSFRCVVIDEKNHELVKHRLPKDCLFLQYKLQGKTSFDQVLGQLGLLPADMIIELAHEISTEDLSRWCFEHKLHMVNAHVSENSAFEEIVELHEQIERLEDGVLADFTRGPTSIFAHGMNPGLVTYCAKIAMRDLAMRLKPKSFAEIAFTSPSADNDGSDVRELGKLENHALLAAATELRVRRLDITEVDTQESTLALPKGCFISTWSCNALHDEVSQCEAVVGMGDNVKSLGAMSIDTCATSVNGAPGKPETFQGFIVAHEECFSLRRLFPNDPPAEIRFVYQPSQQMRDSLHAARNSDEIEFDKTLQILGTDVQPDSYDSVGALVVTEQGFMQWCGLCLRAKDAWAKMEGHEKEALETANATSWLTAAGVLLAIRICLDHPNMGALLAEDLPLSILEPALEDGLIPPFICHSADGLFCEVK